MQTLRERTRGERGASSPTPNLYLSMRRLLVDEVMEDVLYESPAIQELAERIRGDLEIFPMLKRETFKSVAGVDAGSQVLPLASRQYAVICALVYVLPGGGRFFLHPESLSMPYSLAGDKFHGKVNVLREALLYETAARFVEQETGVEMLMIDGPLAFSNWWSLSGAEEDRERLIKAVNGLLSTCRQSGVVVAGIVKRPSARYLVYHMRLENETELSDSYLLLQVLKPGERTDIFSPRSALRKAIRSSPMMDMVETSIYSFYGRMTKDWSIPPIRVDIPAYSLASLDDVADHCYAYSYWGGLPIPIVKADEEVKVSKRFLGDIYSEIVSKIGRELGEISFLAPYWGEGWWMGT